MAGTSRISRLSPDMTVDDLVDVYERTGYNGRRLGEAAKLYAKMIESGATICLAVSGAMTPVGFGGIFQDLIKNGFVDWMITTGANVYHEDHFAWGLPVKQGHSEVDDAILYEKEIVRIRDVYIKFYETLEMQDSGGAEDVHVKPYRWSLYHGRVLQCDGRITREKSRYPERSFVATAHEYDVPVYISTLKDSSLALNLAVHRLRGKRYNLDIAREILEQGAILHDSTRSGIVELGGGVPKNTAQQTGPLLDQILRQGHGGQDYIVQITGRAARYGGTVGGNTAGGQELGQDTGCPQ